MKPSPLFGYLVKVWVKNGAHVIYSSKIKKYSSSTCSSFAFGHCPRAYPFTITSAAIATCSDGGSNLCCSSPTPWHLREGAYAAARPWPLREGVAGDAGPWRLPATSR